MSKAKDSNKVYGQTISFRYYLETRLKPKVHHTAGGKVYQNAYPLYVQIKVKQQTAQKKSSLNQYWPAELFDAYMDEFETGINAEKTAYRNKILADKPFERSNFSLKDTIGDYNVSHDDICYVIGNALFDDYLNNFTDDLESRLKKLNDISATAPAMYDLRNTDKDEDFLEQVVYDFRRRANDIVYRDQIEKPHPVTLFGDVFANAVTDNQKVMSMYNEYGTYFWSLPAYCNFLCEQLNLPIISLELFASEEVRRAFEEKWGTIVYMSVYQSIKKVFAEKMR